MSTTRKPAIARPKHPAEELPERPTTSGAPPVSREPQSSVSGSAQMTEPEGVGERFTEQFNTKMRPSTRAALEDALAVYAYKTGSKATIQTLVDRAVLEYIDAHDLKRP